MTNIMPLADAVSASEVAALRKNLNVCLLDVRTSAEYESMHIPNSHNVPLDQLGTHIDDLAAVEKSIVVVCQAGGRAAQAKERLARAGKDASVLEGGIAAWESAGGEVARGGSEKWALDRQVRLTAGSIVLGGVLASLAAPAAVWVAGGVGAGLVFSAVTNTCAMGNMLAKLPYNKSSDTDPAAVVASLS